MLQSLPEAIAQSWTLPLWPTLSVLIAGILYLRGWRVAHVTRPKELPLWRALCFFAGLLTLWLALASPLDALDEFLLSAHTLQHLMLMSIAPPLLLLGNPVVPLLRGLPGSFVRDELAPWMDSRILSWLQSAFTNPVFGWISMVLAMVVWHVPATYELGLRSNFWHQVEHGCYFFTSLAFWWFVIRPWPNRIRSTRWAAILYLASANFVLFFVGFIIVMDNGIIYPTYAHVPRLFGISALADQKLAGSLMLYIGLLVSVGALFALLMQVLSEPSQRKAPAVPEKVIRPSAGISAPARFDLLHAPVAGRALRSRYGRRALQAVSIIAISAIIMDGLFGVQVSALNLSGSLIWNVLRPLNLLLLLFVANIFCMACPFTLPRELVRRLRIPQLSWPNWLSSKWPAVALMLLFFWAYEQFAIWRSPRDTALLLVAYISSASIINAVFRGASFCKYVCPIGQFNFLASLFAPLELGVRSQHTCSTCSTHDCIRGNSKQHGCELKLYLPNKIGNHDCTLCMDCVKACPHDNVSITVKSPLRDLQRDPVRSSLGRISARPDFALLILVVVFSSVPNAAIMIAPVVTVLDGFRQQHPWAASSLLSLLATLFFSFVLLLLYIGVTRLLQSFAKRQTFRTVFCQFSVALLPLGLSIWLGHLAFHLATTWPSLLVLFKHASAGFLPGYHAAVQHATRMPHKMMTALSSSMVSPLLGTNGTDLFDIQVWIVNVGLFVSWYAGYRVIRQMAKSAWSIWSMSVVWAVSSTTLYIAAVWVFTQPMYMRGVGM